VYDSPNVRDMLASVEKTLASAVLSHIGDPQALQQAQMCMAVLHWAGRLVPVEQQLCLKENREMAELLGRVGRLLDGSDSPEGRRIAERGRAMPSRELPALPAYEQLMTTHRSLSDELIPTLDDLHVLAASGDAVATQALQLVRGYLGRRAKRDLDVYLGNEPPAAMVGRC
jgi:hypothetical protein